RLQLENAPFHQEGDDLGGEGVSVGELVEFFGSQQVGITQGLDLMLFHSGLLGGAGNHLPRIAQPGSLERAGDVRKALHDLFPHVRAQEFVDDSDGFAVAARPGEEVHVKTSLDVSWISYQHLDKRATAGAEALGKMAILHPDGYEGPERYERGTGGSLKAVYGGRWSWKD